jgi:trans-o-hydroxybenzylidenepyruvate hydratase-aldolase
LVATRLRDEVARAKASNDWKTAKAISDDIAATLAPLFPKGSFAEFSKFNIGLEKARIDAAGWMRAGPARPPYHVVPDEYLEGARRSGVAWGKLAAEYANPAARVASAALR